MNSILSTLWQGLKWMGLLGGLVLLGLTGLADPGELPPSSWNGPIFIKDHWELTGIVQHGVQSRRLFEEELDLVEVRFGGGSLWALAGVHGEDGAYESLIRGVFSREDVRNIFLQPRYVTLTIPGTPKAVDHSECVKDPIIRSSSARCRIRGLVEGSRSVMLLDLDEEPTGDLSNVFIHTGVFPAHYLYGFLTWDIQPGRIIEQGLDGG